MWRRDRLHEGDDTESPVTRWTRTSHDKTYLLGWTASLWPSVADLFARSQFESRGGWAWIECVGV
ncbi:unnamed protein product, partial [Protopolystoma xenopodis]